MSIDVQLSVDDLFNAIGKKQIEIEALQLGVQRQQTTLQQKDAEIEQLKAQLEALAPKNGEVIDVTPVQIEARKKPAERPAGG